MPSMASNPSIQVDKLLQQATSSLQKGDYLAAIKTLDVAIQRDRQDVRPYLLLGETYMRLQRYDKAVDTLIAALPFAPDSGQLNYLLAVNYHFQGAEKEAMQYAENSIKIFGQNKDEENFKKSLVLLQGLKSESAPTKSN